MTNVLKINEFVYLEPDDMTIKHYVPLKRIVKSIEKLVAVEAELKIYDQSSEKRNCFCQI